MKRQLKDCHATNMGQWKAEIVTLWVTKVQDFQYCT
jgi:hypothetical protein